MLECRQDLVQLILEVGQIGLQSCRSLLAPVNIVLVGLRLTQDSGSSKNVAV